MVCKETCLPDRVGGKRGKVSVEETGSHRDGTTTQGAPENEKEIN